MKQTGFKFKKGSPHKKICKHMKSVGIKAAHMKEEKVEKSAFKRKKLVRRVIVRVELSIHFYLKIILEPENRVKGRERSAKKAHGRRSETKTCFKCPTTLWTKI